jgi:L-asparaginase
MNHVSILVTGGTFEKVYGRGLGVRELSFPETSAAATIVARHNIKGVTVDYDHTRAKDSLDMTDEDRGAIADWCSQHSYGRCVIIHGTDTMVQTARFVALNCPVNVVVLTGALQPACMRDSDAEFNLGCAIMAARTCQSGVYIAMGGNLFQWDNCRKNPITGHFEAIADE